MRDALSVTVNLRGNGIGDEFRSLARLLEFRFALTPLGKA